MIACVCSIADLRFYDPVRKRSILCIWPCCPFTSETGVSRIQIEYGREGIRCNHMYCKVEQLRSKYIQEGLTHPEFIKVLQMCSRHLILSSWCCFYFISILFDAVYVQPPSMLAEIKMFKRESWSSTSDIVCWEIDSTEHSNLIEPPSCVSAANCKIIELLESRIREIDGIVVTTHALVDNGGCGGFAGGSTYNGDGLPAVRVGVWQGSH